MHPKSKYKISQKKIEDCNFRRWLPKEDVRSDLKLTIYKMRDTRFLIRNNGYYTKKKL